MGKRVQFTILAAFWVSACAHSEPAQGNSPVIVSGEAPPAHSKPRSADPSDSLLMKFDPALRWALQDKTGGILTALVDMDSPLPDGVRSELENQGLVFVSATTSLLHVRGDAQALLRLAARKEVKRLHASGPMKPSLKEH